SSSSSTARWPRVAPPARDATGTGGKLGAPAGLAEAVAHRAHGLDQAGVLLAELGPEPPDVDVDGAGAAVVLVAPDPGQQGLAGEDLARGLGQELEQLVIHVGGVEGPAVDEGLVGLEVEDQRVVLDQLGLHPAARAPELVAQAGFQLPGVERREAEV